MQLTNIRGYLFCERQHARYLEKWKWKKVLVTQLSWLFLTPWTVVHQAPLSTEFSRQEYWSGSPFPSPGDLPDPGTEPGSAALKAVTWGLALTWATWAWSLCCCGETYACRCRGYLLSVLSVSALLPTGRPSCVLTPFLCVCVNCSYCHLSSRLDFRAPRRAGRAYCSWYQHSVTVPLAHNWYLITIWLKNE